MATKFRDGNVTIELSGDLERVSLEAVDRLLPKVREIMQAEVGYVISDSVGPEWPVVSGRSARGNKVVTVLTPDSVAVEIHNAVPYAVYVRPKSWFGTTTAWARLVRAPMRAVAKNIAQRFGHQILQQALKRGGS